MSINLEPIVVLVDRVNAAEARVAALEAAARAVVDDDGFDTRYCAVDGLTVDQLAEIERRVTLAVVRTPASVELGDPMTALRIVAEDVSLLLAEVRRLRDLIVRRA